VKSLVAGPSHDARSYLASRPCSPSCARELGSSCPRSSGSGLTCGCAHLAACSRRSDVVVRAGLAWAAACATRRGRPGSSCASGGPTTHLHRRLAAALAPRAGEPWPAVAFGPAAVLQCDTVRLAPYKGGPSAPPLTLLSARLIDEMARDDPGFLAWRRARETNQHPAYQIVSGSASATQRPTAKRVCSWPRPTAAAVGLRRTMRSADSAAIPRADCRAWRPTGAQERSV